MKTSLPTGMYLKEIKCPVCEEKFSSIRVKSNAVALDRKDEDFCPYYKKLNPMYYEILVCPACAYAASETSFNDIGDFELISLRNAFKNRKVDRDYCGQREWADAVDSYKLALLTATAKKAKPSAVAGICLRIAWLYREKADEKEEGFLKYAYENYRKTYEEEKAPYGNMTEMMLMYLMGELARRLNLIDDAAYWLGKAVQSPERKMNPRIEELARDQFSLVRDEMKKRG